MDRNKIREFVRQAHPKREIMPENDYDERQIASSDDRDVDASNLRLSNWQKFKRRPERAAAAPNTGGDAADIASDARERFRPRQLKGSSSTSSARPAAPRPGADAAPAYDDSGKGKIAIERVRLNPTGADGERIGSSEESMDLVVDEEHGVIGESDSGPED